MEEEGRKELVYLILYSANWLDANLRDLLKPHHITVQQYQVLKLIHDSEELVNHTHLKRNVVEKDADISRLVGRLAQLNLINKSAVKGDKRQHRLRLSKKGQDLMEQLSLIPERVDQLFDHLDASEKEQLVYLLSKTHSS